MAECADLLKREHYLGPNCADPALILAWRKPGGLFGDRGEVVAAAVFAPPAAFAWGPRSIELVRLVRSADLDVPLSMLLAQCVRYLRRKQWAIVIAYADPAVGHHGGIYQAANFMFLGRSHPKVRYRLGSRTMSQRAFDQASARVRAMAWQAERGSSKFIYVYPLVPDLKTRYSERAKPYPKPQMNSGTPDKQKEDQ